MREKTGDRQRWKKQSGLSQEKAVVMAASKYKGKAKWRSGTFSRTCDLQEPGMNCAKVYEALV